MRDYPEEFDYEPICEATADESYYLGSGDDGVYFNAAYFPGNGDNGEGSGWYMSAVVDSETGAFSQALVSDDGPYNSFDAAANAGLNAAIEWCCFNGVMIQDFEVDAIREAIHLDSNFAK